MCLRLWSTRWHAHISRYGHVLTCYITYANKYITNIIIPQKLPVHNTLIDSSKMSWNAELNQIYNKPGSKKQT